LSPKPDATADAPSGRALRHPVRIVTAASLFDGHDAAINIMRRILQQAGAEVIHLGHNRSVREIVDCAIQEDAHAVAITSYQGGHVEYFKYMVDLIRASGEDIKVFGGGGGTILPSEIDELHAYGVDRLYSPDDGRAMGLQGMILDLLRRCDVEKRGAEVNPGIWDGLVTRDPRALAALITVVETHPEARVSVRERVGALRAAHGRTIPVLGITGTGGAGKSSLVDELLRRYLRDQPNKTVAVLSVDPSRKRTGGALLGDRIRMNTVGDARIYMRSLATRQANLALSAHVQDAIDLCKAAGFDLVIVETSGIGQSDTEIIEHSDASLYVMTCEYGAATQLEKIDMLDFADLVAINKFDKPGSEDALRDVRKQVRRNRNAWELSDEALPVLGTVASQFADPGTDALYRRLMDLLVDKTGAPLRSGLVPGAARDRAPIIPGARVRYLADIADSIGNYNRELLAQAEIARGLYQLAGVVRLLRGEAGPTSPALLTEALPTADDPASAALIARFDALREQLHPAHKKALAAWPNLAAAYRSGVLAYTVRGKRIEQPLTTQSLSGSAIPKVSLPRFHDWGDLLVWLGQENLPGSFPYAAGVFPLRRAGEDPARMFAGEGGPERTNRRFHFLSRGMPARRLSTAFDSVTLYGEDPDHRPDIFGKIGNSGVSVANLDDAKRLYSGFDLAHPATSVSMTINGPAPIVLGFYLNAAIDQACERWVVENGLAETVDAQIAAKYAALGLPRPTYAGALPEGNDGLGLRLLGVSGDEVVPPEVYARLRAETLRAVRGTVQADILKEDQAQNTCIFSTEFALRMMGDIQAWFVENDVNNFYSVSISGYHIAEAGANPITQLAFTLANGFTFVEYYLSRGLKIDDFAPNLSFFFSNGMDPEYAVIGRVARKIWAKAIKHRYGGDERSQKLKYHIQTSGRSLHAQEIAFNDIRTTLQALYALYDTCNSLHTNAYDEAITTPTEESVRRALAIQLIINKELGLNKNENPLQGSFIIEELTELVEAAVLAEFRRISDRGGVLGAMERMYQRGKIQDESLLYETQKHTGELPIIGVNTFLDPKGSPTITPAEVIRSTIEERERAITNRDARQAAAAAEVERRLAALQQTALSGGNTFAALMEVTKVATLGQVSRALYAVGGQYRRNM
jgi:methylmalonyl-CoA mutase